jgi:hypothetical protein
MSKPSYASVTQIAIQVPQKQQFAKPDYSISNGQIPRRKFTVSEFRKAKVDTTKTTNGLCKSVYITKGDDDKTPFAEKTYMVQDNTKKNYVLEAILNAGKTEKGTYDFSKTKSFDIAPKDNGKFRIEIIEESKTHVWLKQSNLHFDKYCSSTGLLPFNTRGVWIFK